MFRFMPFIVGAAIAAQFALSINSALAKELVIALSPYHQSAENAQARALEILDVIISLDAGDQIFVIDGYHLNTIATFTIPTDPRYAGKKSRIHANRKAVAGLLGFAKNPLPPGGVDTLQDHAVKLPELLRYVAHNIQSTVVGDGDDAENTPLDIVVIGSARYHDPLSPSFSMRDNRVPGDGHLGRPLSDTPYGITGQEGLLNHTRVHLAFTDQDAELGGRYKDFVRRFWTLYVEALGGKLVTFEAQAGDSFRNIKRGASAPTHAYQRKDTDKLEMIQLRPVTLEVSQSIFQRPLTTTPLSSETIRRGDNLEIGISWQCLECDLDLYAMAYPGAPILFYGQTNSPQGRYWKDYINSPETVNGFETIAYHAALDLRAVRVAINFFKGRAPDGVKGEVRLSVNGRTYGAPFRINAESGIGSGGVKAIVKAGSSSRPETLIVDILRIVGAEASSSSS